MRALLVVACLLLPCAPASAQEIAGTPGDDTIVVTASDADSATVSVNTGLPQPYDDVEQLTLRGGDGDDHFVIRNPAGGLFAPSGGIDVAGEANATAAGDVLTLEGGQSDGGSYIGTAPDAGTNVHRRGALTQTVRFTGLEPVVDIVPAATLDITYNAGADAITLDNGFAPADGQIRVDTPTTEEVEFANKTNVTIAGADGDDTFSPNVTETATGLSTLTVDLGASADDDFTMTGPLSPGPVAFTLTGGGSLTDGNAGTNDVVGTTLAIDLGSGIATVADPLDTQVNAFEAETTTGPIGIIDHAGDVTIGGVTASLGGVRTTSSGDIRVGSFVEDVFLGETTALESVRGASGIDQDVRVEAAQDVIATVNNDAVTAPGGSITVDAGRDVLVGTAGAGFDNDVRAWRHVTLDAERDVIVDGNSDVAADDFGDNTSGDADVFADRAFVVDDTTGGDASVVAEGNAQGFVNVEAPLIRTETLAGLRSATGRIRLDADSVMLNNTITANGASPTASVWFDPLTTGRPVDLGSATDAAAALEISDTEIDRITTPRLVVGATADVGPVTVSQPLTIAIADTTVRVDNGVTKSGTGSITAPKLAVIDGGTGTESWTLTPTEVQFKLSPGVPYVVDQELAVGVAAGADTFNVLGTAAGTDLTRVVGGAGDDTVIAGNAGSLAAFAGPLVVDGLGNTDELVVDATSDGASAFTAGAGSVAETGTLAATFTTVENVRVRGGGAADTFAVDAATTPLLLEGGGGGDTFTAGTAGGSLSGLTAAITVDGQGGADALVADGNGDPGARTWTLAPGSVARTGDLALTYTGVETGSMKGGAGADTVAMKASPVTPWTLDGGDPSTAPGDTLNYDVEGRSFAGDTTPPDGQITSPGVQPVTFTKFETVTPQVPPAPPAPPAPPEPPAPPAPPAPPVTDTTAPKLAVIRPEGGTRNVWRFASVRVRFDEAIDTTTLVAANFRLRRVGAAKDVAAKRRYDALRRRWVLDPAGSLARGKTYEVTVAGVRDLAGNVLATATFRFTVRKR